MLIYLCTFSISCFFIYLAELVSKRGKLLCVFLLLLAITIPSLLAGVRSLNIGTDVLNYVDPIYQSAIWSKNFFQFLNLPILNGVILVPISSFEPGYAFFVFIVAKIFRNLFFVLFFTQFFILGFIISGLWCLRDRMSVCFGMLVYYLCFFNTSLNIVRQSMAIAVLVYGFKYLIEKKYFKYVLITIFACLFHRTAIFGFLILMIYYIMLPKNRKYFKVSYKEKIILITLSATLIVFITPLRNLILSIIGLNKYVDGYLNGNISFVGNQILLRIPFFTVLLLQWKKTSIDKNIKVFFLAELICDLMVSQLSGISESSARITLYFSIYYIFILPLFLYNKKDVKGKVLFFFIMIYLLVYWYYSFVIMQYSETIPFVFSPNFNF